MCKGIGWCLAPRKRPREISECRGERQRGDDRTYHCVYEGVEGWESLEARTRYQRPDDEQILRFECDVLR